MNYREESPNQSPGRKLVRQKESGPSAPDSPSSGSSRGYWKHHLFLLQESAPSPKPVVCRTPISWAPPYYGPEFHGVISRESADQLLAAIGEGAFLVRESQRAPGSFTLCMRFNSRTMNYKLFYDGSHYVGEKRFDTIEDLVADGLICMFMEVHAADYIRKMTEEAVYEESPYSQYQRLAGQQKRNQQHSPSPRLSRTSEDREDSGGSGRPRPASLAPPAKAHAFKLQTFRVPHYCDYCRNFMWGLVQQGLRCEDCGFSCHKKCSERTHKDCLPDLRYVKRMFGVDLTTLCMAHGVAVPPVLEHCIIELERRGLDCEGLYRISGSHDDIEKLRCAYDTSKMDLQRLAKVEDIHTVGSLLKLYLRLLPQPVIPFSVCRTLLGLLQRKKGEAERTRAAKEELATLPDSHYNTLRLLIHHLGTVAEHSNANRMNAENLARIFAPTLLCAASPLVGTNPLALPQQDQYLLAFLIANHSQLFT